MAMGAFLYARSGEEVPDGLGPPAAAMAAFHRRATECLILSKYFSSPGPYTIEALLVNQQFEFMRTKDARLGVWLMGGTIIRLAFRMGYHRDPDAYPRISVHQGEIRRRIWALILQLDALTSYQMGLPAMVQDAHCDTKPPRNLFDEDFGPDMKQLPPSRPESEVTPILYVINKVRISACFREIYSRVALGGSDDYAEIMALHQRLLTAHDSVSPRLQLSNLQDTVTVQPHLLLRRCMLELLFLKCLCILHRRHMTKSFTQAQFSQSRSLCVEAAMSILAIQSDMLDEKKYGPILRASKGLISSLEQTDFILAATIICLELSSGSPEIPQTTREHPKFTRTDLLVALHASHRLLAKMKDASADCQQAYQIVSHIMQWLDRRGSTHANHETVDSLLTQTGGAHCTTNDQASRSIDTSEAEDPAGSSTQATNPSTMLPDQFSPSFFDTSGMESFFDDPHSADWVSICCDRTVLSRMLTTLRTCGRRSFETRMPGLMLDA
jgi:hypothetical protein